jgi:O-methyltransferase domain/Dimerisation domain
MSLQAGSGNRDEEVSPGWVLDLIMGKWRSQAVCVAAELGIADILKDGPRSTLEIANLVDATEDAVYRLLRALASLGLFSSLPERCFALTPLGCYLRSDVPGSLRGFARFAGHDVTWRPWGELGYSIKSGKPAVDHVFGVGIFHYLEKHPDVAAVVNDAMTALTAAQAAAVVEAYNFAGISTLVDVGGGHGLLLATILKANPGMRGTLFELSHAVEGARRLFRQEGLTDRCAVVAGDFFDAVPPGGDAYIMKLVIHDWDDERAIRILRNCHRAMRPRSKLLVVDRVIAPGDEADPAKFVDLEMLVLTHGGRERTQPEFKELYDQAGFEFVRVVATRGPISVIEGTSR